MKLPSGPSIAVSVVVVIVLLVIAPPALYFAAYFGLAVGKIGNTKIYRAQWQAEIFAPAGKIEGKITGKRTPTGWDDRFDR